MSSPYQSMPRDSIELTGSDARVSFDTSGMERDFRESSAHASAMFNLLKQNMNKDDRLLRERPSKRDTSGTRKRSMLDIQGRDGNLFEWVVVFGGTTETVDKLLELRARSPHKILMESFRNGYMNEQQGVLEEHRHRPLQCWESVSKDRTKLFVLVSATDEVLLREAVTSGFLKNTVDPGHKRCHDLNYVARNRTKFSHTGKQANHEKQRKHGDVAMLGEVAWRMGYAPFKLGDNNKHLSLFEYPGGFDDIDTVVGAHTSGDRRSYFNSGERQRLVESIMCKCKWQDNIRGVSDLGHDFARLIQAYHFSGDQDGDNDDEYFFRMDLGSPEHPVDEVPRLDDPSLPNLVVGLVDIFPAHNESERKYLQMKWGNFGMMLPQYNTMDGFHWPILSQPIDEIRRYFGTHVGLYFAWIEIYTKMLIYPALFGAVIYGYQISEGYQSPDQLGSLVVAYAIFLALWSTLFLEVWKRRENSLCYLWGTADAESAEPVLKTFKGVDVEKDWGETVHEYKHFIQRLPRYVASVTIMSLFIFAALVSCGIAMVMKAAGQFIVVEQPGHTLTRVEASLGYPNNTADKPVAFPDGSAARAVFQWCTSSDCGIFFEYGSSLFNVVCIVVFSQIFKKVAPALNKMENHRTQTEADDSTILKSFLFQSVNNYFLLFFLAFARLGTIMGVQDQCSTRAGIEYPDCLYDLNVQMFMVFTLKTFLQQLQEIFAPLIQRKIRERREKEAVGKLAIQMEEDHEELTSAGMVDEAAEPDTYLTPWEQQEISERYGGVIIPGSTYEDMLEMCLQFGFLTIFAVSMPIAPMLAFINNLFEIRVDGRALTNEFRRPRYREAKDIGSWAVVLDAMSNLAVVTNGLLVTFVGTCMVDMIYEESDPMYQERKTHIMARYKDPALWAVFVILEHSLFLVKYALAIFIPDYPQAISDNRKGMEHFVKKVSRKKGCEDLIGWV